MKALENNRIWIVTEFSPGKRAIGCKWGYCVKYKARCKGLHTN